MNQSIEEEIQTKSIDNLSNNKIAENFPNLEKERDVQVLEDAECHTFRTRKETPPDIIKTLNIQNKERILKAAYNI
jgi:hypothetical protein